MSYLKKAWITELDGTDLTTLSLESQDPEGPACLIVRELKFPMTGPKRHTICITYLTDDDLLTLYAALQEHIYGL